MELEHKAETLQPQPGAGVAVKVADILAVDQHGPAGGAVQKAEQIEQRRLAAARGTDDRREASPFDDEVRVLHKKHRRLSRQGRSEEHTSELQSLMRISYAVFCLKKKKHTKYKKQ